jgi:ABC-2 type transport system ATP-binding protein
MTLEDVVASPGRSQAREVILSVRDLQKEYYYGEFPVPALNGVTFDLRAGEFMGMFGPNGAGKTTTTKVIVGLVRPKSGSVTVGGHDATTGSAAKMLIGYVPQQGSLLGSLTTREELVFHARSYGLAKGEAARRTQEVAELLEIGDLLGRDVQKLSGGQRRRVEIALALVHRPEILVLDEPTLGLDPHTRVSLWAIIRELRERLGTTILMTTHYLDEASSLMDRIVIMDHGRVVASGSPAEIVAENARGSLRIGPFDDPDAVLEALVQLRPRLGSHDDPQLDGRWVAVGTAQPDVLLPALLAALQERGITVHEASSNRPTVSDAFFAITGRQLAA